MNYSLENSTLIFKYCGKIDTSNAQALGEEMLNIASDNPANKYIFDATNLEYISSAGLRIMLKFKKAYSSFSIINASLEVYDIFEMTGFTEILTIKKALRKMSVAGCKVIGAGAKGIVYRYNADTIVKVYKSYDCLDSINQERDLARKAFILGIPTAISYDIVDVDGKYGSVFELLDCASLTDYILKNPADFDHYVKEYTNLLKQIHSTIVDKNDMPDAKIRANMWVDDIKDIISAPTYNKLKSLIYNAPNTMNMLHNDYHTNNILMQNGEAILIDMDTLSYGHPLFELANIYVAYVGFGEVDEKLVKSFLNMPYSLAVKFFDEFSHLYLSSYDYDDCMNKIKLLAYARLARHFLVRNANDEYIKIFIKKIEQLLPRVNKLDF